MIVHDSNRTPFIHVIKSVSIRGKCIHEYPIMLALNTISYCFVQGQVKVMRYQTVYDATLYNSRKFNSRTKEEIGCGKILSAMLEVGDQRSIRHFEMFIS